MVRHNAKSGTVPFPPYSNSARSQRLLGPSIAHPVFPIMRTRTFCSVVLDPLAFRLVVMRCKQPLVPGYLSHLLYALPSHCTPRLCAWFYHSIFSLAHFLYMSCHSPRISFFAIYHPCPHWSTILRLTFQELVYMSSILLNLT
jgi:hypothetical protein